MPLSTSAPAGPPARPPARPVVGSRRLPLVSSARVRRRGVVRRAAGALAVGAVLLVVVAACGEEETVAPSEVPVEEGPAGVEEDSAVEEAGAPDAPVAPMEDPSDGADPAEEPHHVVVLEDSLTIAADGRWYALGMVRNDGDHPVGEVEVQAALVADGAVLEQARASVAVEPLAPGDEAPFRVEAPEVPIAAVDEVRWDTTAAILGEVEAPPALRLGTHWTRGYSDDRSIDVPGYRDEPGRTNPYVLYGSAENTGDAPVERPGVVAVWRDPDGRVLAVADAPVLSVGGGPVEVLEAGAELDFVIVVDDPVSGPELHAARSDLWGVTR